MKKNLLKNFLLVCLLALPCGLFAQSINRTDLLDKTWYFVAVKCSDKVATGSESQFIHFYSSLKLTASNSNNINYGTYVKIHKDMRDNPIEKGTYTMTTDEVGNVVLTLKRGKSGVTAKYNVPMVEANHLTLIRIDEGDKCNVSYAVAP